MKFGGHSLHFRFAGRLVGRVEGLRSRCSRARYFRGHGVHSPFVYDLVRDVFMRHELLPGSRELYRELLAQGIAPRRAIELQNLAIHCGCVSFGLNRADAEFCVVLPDLTPTEVLDIVHAAADAEHLVAVLSPYASRERQALCRQIVHQHPSTTVDNRGYLLVFNNHLPKQHFRI